MDPRQPIPGRPPAAPAERWNPFEQYDQFRRPGVWTPQQVFPNPNAPRPMQPAPMAPSPQGSINPDAIGALAALFMPRN